MRRAAWLLLSLALIGVARAEEEADAAAIGSRVEVKLGVELRLRGFPLPGTAPVGDREALLGILHERLGEEAPARAAVEGYRWGVAFTSRGQGGDLVVVTLFATASEEAARTLRDTILLTEAQVDQRIPAEGGKLVDSARRELEGGYALERSAVLQGAKGTTCLDKLVVSSGRWVVEVGHVAPLARRSRKLRETLLGTALRAVSSQ